KATAQGTMLGGDCEFVGFPYGGGWVSTYEKKDSIRFPFIKHCTVSGIVAEPNQMWVLDGINNDGFSGGPVVFGTGGSQQVIGVISGFRREPIDIVPVSQLLPKASRGPEAQEETHPKEAALANSGFIFAYSISLALDAIHKNPIGPSIDTRTK